MGTINIRKEGEALKYVKDKAKQIKPQAKEMIDDVADIYFDALQDRTPIGETKKLYKLATIKIESFLARYIYSKATYFDWIVGGHKVYGPIFSEKQRRWWFWYLHNVLGGSYKRKTDGKTEPNDYPLDAFTKSDSNVNARVNKYLDWIGD